MKSLIALYPARWRQRYGTEMAHLLKDLAPFSLAARLRVAADLIRGAIGAHLSKEFRMTIDLGGAIRGYPGVPRHRWRIVLGLAVLGLLAAAAYVTVVPRVYTATAAVNVEPTAANQNNAVAGSHTVGATVNLDTEAQVAVSIRVAAIARRMLHSPVTPWTLAQRVTDTIPPNSTLLDIACTASSAIGAATCANDFAKAYLQNRSQSATNYLNQQLAKLHQKINALNQAESALSTKISALPSDSPARAADQARLKTDQNQSAKLTQQYAATSALAAQTNGGAVITSATPPGNPSSPSNLLVLPGGLAAGLLLGLIAAFLRDRRDKRQTSLPTR